MKLGNFHLPASYYPITLLQRKESFIFTIYKYDMKILPTNYVQEVSLAGKSRVLKTPKLGWDKLLKKFLYWTNIKTTHIFLAHALYSISEVLDNILKLLFFYFRPLQ